MTSKKIFSIIFIIFIFLFFILFSSISYCKEIENNFKNNIFRLHIIANSDSAFDQKIKYEIRNNILNYMNSLDNNFFSKESVINFMISHKSKFLEISSNTLKHYNLNYSINIEIGNFYFPTKQYNNLKFPKGFYNGLKITLGKGKGKNWWCVMFPPLCLINSTTCIFPNYSEETLKNNLNSDNYNLISNYNNSDSIKFKFKLYELLESLKKNLKD